VKKSDMTYILSIVFAAATSVAYCCVRWFKIEMLRYYPLEHAWKWGKQGGPSQAWYSIQVFAFLCGGAAAFLVYVVLKSVVSKTSELSARDAKRLGIAGTVLILVCMAYIAFYEYSHWGIL
jgi:ABC-type Fe3+-siderophore transport system permease subunit